MIQSYYNISKYIAASLFSEVYYLTRKISYKLKNDDYFYRICIVQNIT